VAGLDKTLDELNPQNRHSSHVCCGSFATCVAQRQVWRCPLCR